MRLKSLESVITMRSVQIALAKTGDKESTILCPATGDIIDSTFRSRDTVLPDRYHLDMWTFPLHLIPSRF